MNSSVRLRRKRSLHSIRHFFFPVVVVAVAVAIVVHSFYLPFAYSYFLLLLWFELFFPMHFLLSVLFQNRRKNLTKVFQKFPSKNVFLNHQTSFFFPFVRFVDGATELIIWIMFVSGDRMHWDYVHANLLCEC